MPEIVDAIVDLTETGSTLRRNGMVVIAELLTSYTEVVANAGAAADTERRQAWTTWSRCWSARSPPWQVPDQAQRGRRRPGGRARGPAGHEGAHDHPLAGSGYHAVETVVDKAGVNRLIPTLKGAGAFDILELPIAKIVT